MTASKALLYFCLSFIGGIFLSSLFSIPQFLMLGFLIFGILLIFIFWPLGGIKTKIDNKNLVIVGFCLILLLLGIWRKGVADSKIVYPEERDVAFIGIIVEEPDVRSDNTKLTIKPIEDFKEITGRVLITTDIYPKYQYGDKLKIEGKIKIPPEFEDFNYKNYLKKDGIYSVMSWSKIEFIGSNFGSPLKKTLFSFKNKFKETVQKFISPPQEGILEALFFGDETNISKEWKDKLNLTGTRHIAAVSGMNITIIAFLILSFALSFGLWRFQAFYLSLFLLFFYIIMIGAPSSAIRAGVMGSLLMVAQYFGRLSIASRAVVFAAALMLLINPLFLTLDVGFQLSFLAIFGLIYLQPSFFQWLKKIPNSKIFPIRTTLSATLSAQIFTLPILIYNFGYISLISPLANILIVPILAPLTILIFIFGVAGMIFYPLGLILSWIVWLPLTYIVKIVDWSSKISFASLAIKNLHFLWLIVSYLILGYFAFWLKKRESLKFLNY
mgnify:CR=1 FL=1